MKQHAITKEIAAADQAINARDLVGILDFYTDDAALVVTPELIVNGHPAIKDAHQRIADYFNGTLKVSQGRMVVIEAGDTALVLAQTFVESPDKPDTEYPGEREAIYVYKKDAVGKWRCAIDNSYGVELLRQQT